MIKILLLCGACCLSAGSFAQNVGIGAVAPDSSAQLDIKSTTRGLLIPSLTQSQMQGIQSPAAGLLIFQTDHTPGFYYNAGTPATPSWQSLASPSGPTAWKLTGNSGTNPATDFVGTADNKPLVFRLDNVTAGYLDSVKAKTSLGYAAGNITSTGYGNVAVGKNALTLDSAASVLVAVGDSALNSCTQGSGTVAVGYYSLAGVPNSLENTAMGYYSLYAASGHGNTATGKSSLIQNTYSYNTAKGSDALTGNLGDNNTALGQFTLGGFSSGGGSYGNTVAGVGALFNPQTGNSNTACGEHALSNTSIGGSNTAAGSAALAFNERGSRNTAIGDSALAWVDASTLTAIGANAQQHGSAGPEGDNTSAGAYSLCNNTGGVFCTANGAYSLYYNSGKANTATGYYALSGTSQNGDDNTAYGAYTLTQVVVNDRENTAYGNYALNHSAGGDFNTAAGFVALYTLQSSKYNTAVGYAAGAGYVLSHANVILGANCDFNMDGLTNSIAIGQQVTCTDNNQVVIGNLATNSIGGQVGWSTLSDGRFKKNIREDVKGLDFILRLKPITYNLDIDRLDAKLHPKGPAVLNAAIKSSVPSNAVMKGSAAQAAAMKNSAAVAAAIKNSAVLAAALKEPVARDAAMRTAMTGSAGVVHSGFVAQDVEKAAVDAGFNFGGVVKPSTENGLYALRYEDFVVPLVKAVQEQQHQIESLQKGDVDMDQRLQRIEEKLKH